MFASEFNKNIKKALISYKKNAIGAFESAGRISELFNKNGIGSLVKPSMDITADDGAGAGIVVVCGGDGTLLITFGNIYPHEIPIIGINFGKLGFLVDISDGPKDEIFKSFFDGTMEFNPRMILDISVVRNGNIIKKFVALNEAVILREKNIKARIIDLAVFADGMWLNNFRADGLIVATPTGSTAYSLSAGGPVVQPDIDAFILTPICPHTLTNRPVIINPCELKIKITLQERDIFVSADGRDGLRLACNDEIFIKKHSSKIYLAVPANFNYWDVLRSKLKW